MNAAIVLLVVCAAAVEVFAGPHGPMGEKMKKHMDECIESTGADPELIKAAKSGASVVDEKVKCFSLCLGKKIGSVNEDGTFNKEKANHLIAQVPEEQQEEIRQAVDKCADIKGESECDTAYRSWECMRPLMKHRHRKQHRE